MNFVENNLMSWCQSLDRFQANSKLNYTVRVRRSISGFGSLSEPLPSDDRYLSWLFLLL